jgi:hypothetical protein
LRGCFEWVTSCKKALEHQAQTLLRKMLNAERRFTLRSNAIDFATRFDSSSAVPRRRRANFLEKSSVSRRQAVQVDASDIRLRIGGFRRLSFVGDSYKIT